MIKSKLLGDLFIFGTLFGLLAFVIYQIVDSRAYRRFNPNIAECREINEVTVIAAGRLNRPNEKTIPFGNKRKAAQDELGLPPKLIYTFKSVKAYNGPSGTISTSNRGNYRSGFNLMIREGEAPEGVLGKRALICVGGGGRARTLEAIYIEK